MEPGKKVENRVCFTNHQKPEPHGFLFYVHSYTGSLGQGSVNPDIPLFFFSKVTFIDFALFLSRLSMDIGHCTLKLSKL